MNTKNFGYTFLLATSLLLKISSSLLFISNDLKRFETTRPIRKVKNVCKRARMEKDGRCVGERAEMSPRNEHLAIYHAMPPRFTIQASYLTF